MFVFMGVLRNPMEHSSSFKTVPLWIFSTHNIYFIKLLFNKVNIFHPSMQLNLYKNSTFLHGKKNKSYFLKKNCERKFVEEFIVS